MATEATDDLKLAMVQVAAADTGTGGLVELVGRASPLVLESTVKPTAFPAITYRVLDDREESTADHLEASVRFAVWVDESVGSDYVERAAAIRKRIRTVMTAANLAAHGVNAAPVKPRRRDGPLSGGVLGLFLELDFLNVTRSV
jgi:hypothetical protein